MLQFNIVYISLFCFGSIWTIYKIVKTNPNIIIQTRFISITNIIFILVGVFSVLSLFVNNTLIDFIRTFVMLMAIALYLILKDGLGDNGFYINGHFTSYRDVIYYDYVEDKKKFGVVFKLKDIKGKEQFNSNLNFNFQDKDKVIKILKKKMPKKQRRIK